MKTALTVLWKRNESVLSNLLSMQIKSADAVSVMQLLTGVEMSMM